MEKDWSSIEVHHVSPKKQPKKTRRVKDTKEAYLAYIKKLEDVVSVDEMREIANKHTTKRKSVDFDNICRVVPADWVQYPNLLNMNKENYIYPEHIVKDMFIRIKELIIRNKDR